MSTKNKAKKTQPALSPVDQTHYERLLIWARIMAALQDLENHLDAAHSRRAIDGNIVRAALECLSLAKDDLIRGIPTPGE